MICLAPRLRAVAELVRPEAAVADIGADHAHLCVWLVQSGKCPRAIASDINEGPLANARRTAENFGLGEKIEFRMGFGLEAISPDEADDIVIAGMGGNLIIEIIGGCGWLKSPGKCLVLQPMSRPEDLRRYLCENGYSILCESAAAEGRRVYCAMQAAYTGKSINMPEAYYYVGELPGNMSLAAESYIKAQAARVKKRAEGLMLAGKKDGAKKLFELSEEILNSL